jgi:hypothetical protein
LQLGVFEERFVGFIKSAAQGVLDQLASIQAEPGQGE